ncbi:class I SAM-dependent methyltransferase [Streptomyces sp. NPDC050738]|uniref:class I SAM-dependent methyltransferase n=1 Tax=Streptomyces sp. NPDC050738 TaxID=3154744 RepID=UPI00343FAAEE
MPRRTTCSWCESPRLSEHIRTTDLVQHKPGVFVIDRCDDCGHSFQNPQLTPEGLEFYYRDCYDGLGEEATAKIFNGNGSTTSYRGRAASVARFAQPERWLDVGTGHGHFCAEAKKILPATVFDGLDVSDGVEIARREGRVDTAHRGFFPDLASTMPGQYDAVSMFHYLEHTIDPRAELAAAHEALSPGGHLVIDVPDPESLMGKVLGRWWICWFQPQHLNFITRRNIRRALEETGFTVVAVERRDPHIPADLVAALALWMGEKVPRGNAPWFPKVPSKSRLRLREALFRLAIPLFLAAYAVDRLAAPLARRTSLSNAYRIVARRN